VYESPVNVFAATFIGETNLMKAEVVEVEDEYYVVESPGIGQFRCYRDKEAKKGDVLLITLRPEKIRISKREFQSGKIFNVFHGIVEEEIYMGHQTKYFVRLDEGYIMKVYKQHARYILDEPIIKWEDEVLFLFILPISIVFVYSFLEPQIYGGIKWSFSLEAYSYLPRYLALIWRSVWIAGVATFITLAVAVPVAFYIARSKLKNFLLLLTVIPFWTNSLIRIYAWKIVLGNNGLINQFLGLFGIGPVQFLYNSFAVILVIVYTYLPFAILPLYAAMEKVEDSILEVSLDLGASRMYTFTRVLLPNVRAGLLTAFVFVFIPALGSYAIPDLVGGVNSKMIGNEIVRQLLTVRNWPVASAMSNILTLIALLSIIFVMKRGERR
jgi:spermidine/putrescine transport system permease protein